MLHRNKPADGLGLLLGPLSRPLASGFSSRSFIQSGSLPLGVGLAWSLRRNFETFLDLFIPAAVHNLAFFSVLIEASFCEGCLTDFGVHGLAVLRGLVVAYLMRKKQVIALLTNTRSEANEGIIEKRS